MVVTVNFDVAAVAARARTAAMAAVVRGTESVRSEAISLILNTPKTGRLYWRAGISKTSKSGASFSGGHQASAPGEAPASDTGHLVNSIRTDYIPAEIAGTVTASTEYAAHLEYGTQRMEPRPYMRPAVASQRAAIVRDIELSVLTALSRGLQR